MKRLLLVALLALFVVGAACSSDDPTAAGSKEVPLDAWKTDPTEPYPFTTPIPPKGVTPIDGEYHRIVPVEDVGEPVPCRRCAPYRIYAGEATLSLQEGRFHVKSLAATTFASAGHYTIDGDTVTFINDVVCSKLTVTYEWSITDGVLSFVPLQDPCAFDNLRGRYLTAYEWVPVD